MTNVLEQNLGLATDQIYTQQIHFFEQHFGELSQEQRLELYCSISERIQSAKNSEDSAKILEKPPEVIQSLIESGYGYIHYNQNGEACYFVSASKIGEEECLVFEMGGFIKLTDTKTQKSGLKSEAEIAFETATIMIKEMHPNALFIATSRNYKVTNLITKAGYKNFSFGDHSGISRLSCDESCSGQVNQGIDTKTGCVNCSVMSPSCQATQISKNTASDSCVLQVFNPELLVEYDNYYRTKFRITNSNLQKNLQSTRQI